MVVFKITCITDVIIVEPPGDPRMMKGEPFLITIVGVIELSGLLFASIEFVNIRFNKY